MPTLHELIEDRNRRLQAIPDQFLSEVARAEKKIFTEIIDLLNSLDRVNGEFVISSSNLTKAAEISERLKEVFLQSDYIEAVASFAGEFDRQAVLTDEYLTKAFPDYTPSDLSKVIVQNAKRDTVNILVRVSPDNDFITPVARQIELAVTSGSSYKELLNTLQSMVTGDDRVDGKILHYSKELAHDAFALSDRAHTSQAAEELEIEFFLWSGRVIDSTRAFCKQRAGKYFHYKEIEGWADEDWKGKMEGTTSKTIFTTGGGYNCLHSVLPVSVFIVPADVIERNIANGNYKPSKVEMEELAL